MPDKNPPAGKPAPDFCAFDSWGFVHATGLLRLTPPAIPATTFVIHTFFSEKRLLTHIVACQKYENPPTGKPAPDFHAFDSCIILKYFGINDNTFENNFSN